MQNSYQSKILHMSINEYCIVLEQQLYNKFLRLKDNFDWREPVIPENLFTEDVALMIGDTEIHQMVLKYDNGCDIFINPGKYLTHSALAFAFQKDFALKEIIDFQLLKFKQMGLLNKLAKKYFKHIPQNCVVPVRELSFHSTFVSFAILVSGFIIAIGSLLVEKITFILSKRT
jgi:hypothetical protein